MPFALLIEVCFSHDPAEGGAGGTPLLVSASGATSVYSLSFQAGGRTHFMCVSVHTALLTLKEGFEGAMDHTNIEVGIVGADGAFKVLTPAEIKDYLGEVE